MKRQTDQLARAVGAAIVDGEQRILLVQQAYGHCRWGLPGRHLGAGVHPADAVVAEVLLEVGVESRVTGLVGLYRLTGGDDGLPDLLTYVLRCEVVAGAPVVNERGRITRVAWHSAAAVPPPITVTARAAAADVAAGLVGVVRDLSR